MVKAGSAPLSPKENNVEGWRVIQMDASERTALDLSEMLEDYVTAFAATADLTHDEDLQNVYSVKRSLFAGCQAICGTLYCLFLNTSSVSKQ